MSINPLKKLEALGQSIWLDYIKRDLMSSGKLKALIIEDGLSGITSNPSIFEEAISKSQDYVQAIQTMAREKQDVNTIYETLTQQDVRAAADEFRPLYNSNPTRDGYVSLEVNPHLAHDTQGTIAEARRLWQALARPNVLIKVPGTLEGLPAITQLISEGININVTLLFSLSRYQEVAAAYLAGIQARIATGQPVAGIVSVASFFLSRIDTLVDPMLEKFFTQDEQQAALAKKLHGQIAIAAAKVAYQMYQEIFNNDSFKQLAAKGALTQRLLWASTSTKNPTYSDIKYVEAIIGADTINTIPMETLNKYRDHGDPAASLLQDVEQAHWLLDNLSKLGINFDAVTKQLEDEGVAKFKTAFDELQAAIQKQIT